MDYFSFEIFFENNRLYWDFIALKNIIIIIHFQSIIIDYFCYFVETDNKNPI